VKKILIVGQGLAGSVLAEVLRRRGVGVAAAEAGFADSSSAAAAGVINPVTGKRYARSWRFEEFFPVAKRFYEDQQSRFNQVFWFDQPIRRILASVEEANNWSARCGLPTHREFLEEAPDGGPWRHLLRPGFFYGRIRQAARVDLPGVLSMIRKGNMPVEKDVQPADYGRWLNAYDLIITCEGHRGRENPCFEHLPWENNKGEALIISFSGQPAPPYGEMLKKKIMVTAIGENRYWAGSPYEWEFTDGAPSPAGRAYIEQELETMLAVPFTVLDHVAGIRPSVKDRRPFLGFSPENPRVGIFNGLGTKGALLAPYWAEHFADHILLGMPLDPEVDIRRFG
jgi:glycine oxidase